MHRKAPAIPEFTVNDVYVGIENNFLKNRLNYDSEKNHHTLGVIINSQNFDLSEVTWWESGNKKYTLFYTHPESLMVMMNGVILKFGPGIWVQLEFGYRSKYIEESGYKLRDLWEDEFRFNAESTDGKIMVAMYMTSEQLHPKKHKLL